MTKRENMPFCAYHFVVGLFSCLVITPLHQIINKLTVIKSMCMEIVLPFTYWFICIYYIYIFFFFKIRLTISYLYANWRKLCKWSKINKVITKNWPETVCFSRSFSFALPSCICWHVPCRHVKPIINFTAKYQPI